MNDNAPLPPPPPIPYPEEKSHLRSYWRLTWQFNMSQFEVPTEYVMCVSKH